MNPRAALLLSFFAILFLTNCKSSYHAGTTFNTTGSDPQAIAIADKVMQAMGGYRNWSNTRYIGWDFFTVRSLVWDKKLHRVRIESPKKNYVIVLNLNDMSGKVMWEGKEVTHPDTLKKYLNLGRDIWINDSYWLFMPFKLKDSGVTLKYKAEEVMMGNVYTDKLQLTFDKVGVTPENMYNVWVDKNTHLVVKWEYYSKPTREHAEITNTWGNYKKYGKILLSDDRGERGKLRNIFVTKNYDEAAFNKLALSKLE